MMLGFIPRRLISLAFILLVGALIAGCGKGAWQGTVTKDRHIVVTVFHAVSLAETMGE